MSIEDVEILSDEEVVSSAESRWNQVQRHLEVMCEEVSGSLASGSHFQ